MKGKSNNIFWKVLLTEIALIILCIFSCVILYIKSTRPAKAENNPLNRLYVEMPNGEQVPWEKTRYSRIIISSKAKKQIIAEATPLKKNSKHRKNMTIKYDNSSLRQLVTSLAEDANFENKNLIHKVIKCESGWNPKIINTSSWDYGLWQINLHHNPDVTRSCALDPVCSTRWAINEIQSGNLWKWKASRDCWGDSI